MTTKHTPGPWLFRTAPTSAGLCHIVSAADWKGAFIYGDGIRKGVDDALPKAQELAANARLIAAAPDLLRYLKEARRTLEMWKDVAPAVSLCADIDAAIARATGESK